MGVLINVKTPKNILHSFCKFVSKLPTYKIIKWEKHRIDTSQANENCHIIEFCISLNKDNMFVDIKGKRILTKSLDTKNKYLWQYQETTNVFLIDSVKDLTITKIEESTIINSSDYYEHKINGEFHTDNDEPSRIIPSVIKEWHRDGIYYRDNDLPARVFADGTEHYYLNGKLGRNNDQPAIVSPSGYKAWYISGKLGRLSNKPTIIFPKECGDDIHYHRLGELHRDDDQPAIIQADGTMHWYQYGNLHRTQGPSRIYPDGRCEWYNNGVHITSITIDYNIPYKKVSPWVGMTCAICCDDIWMRVDIVDNEKEYSYCQGCIKEWFKKSNRNPLTNIPLASNLFLIRWSVDNDGQIIAK